MKRLDRYVGSFDGPLKQTPVVFQAVCVNRTVKVTLSMVHDLMCVLVQAFVRHGCIGVYLRARRHDFTNDFLKVALLALRHVASVDLARLAVEQAE